MPQEEGKGDWRTCRDFLLGCRVLGPSDYLIELHHCRIPGGGEWLGPNFAHGSAEHLTASPLLP